MGLLDLICTDEDVLEYRYLEPDGLYTNGETGEFAGDLHHVSVSHRAGMGG